MKQYSLYMGKYKLYTAEIEVKMSHWVTSFFIKDEGHDLIVLDFRMHTCDLVRYDEVEEQVNVVFRIYPYGDVTHCISINFQKGIVAYIKKEYDFTRLEELFKDMKI